MIFPHNPLRSHISAGLYAVRRILRHLRLEARLNVLEHLLVFVAGKERYGQALCSETTCTTDAVEVRVGIGGHVVVDGKIDSLNVDTSAENIRCDTDALVEFLELFVALDTNVYVSTG